MAGFDVHQHLWPRAFSEALRAAHRASAPRRRRPARVRGRVDRRPRAITSSRRGSRCSTCTRSTRPSSRCSRRSASTALDPAERDELVAIWEDGILELAAAAARPDRAARVGRPRPGFAGVSIGADRLRSTWRSSRRRSTRWRGQGLPVRPPGRRRPARRRTGLVAGRRRLHEPDAAAYFAWLAAAQERWPDVTVVFAILAGGAPIQLERLASRGVDVRSSLHRNVFFDTASYGRRALELVHRDLRRRAARLRHATSPSSTRRRRFAPSTRSVSPSPRLIRQDNLIGLLQ